MDQISTLIGRIYDSALGMDDWSSTLSGVADFCGGANAALVLSDPRLELSRVTTPRADPSVVEDYGQYWWQHDPTAQRTARIAPGVITDLDHTGRERFLASRFHNEYWARSGLGAHRLASNVFTDGVAFGSLVLQAAPDRDEITTEMRERFGALVPHLIRAIEARRRMEYLSLALRTGTGQARDGIILVDGAKRVLLADDEALSTLGESDALDIHDNTLRFFDPRASLALEAALADSRTSEAPEAERRDCIIPCRHGPAHLNVEIVGLGRAAARADLFAPLFGRPAAIVTLRHSERQRERAMDRLSAQFGLTAAEARLALEVARGDGREAAARRCSISLNTARTHLMRVFEKTGARRQAELLRLLNEMGII
ncbi:transcriptional regulator [Sinisalibacter lacisalsi]|uniref:Transcriptional regulator n=2 Tax=Sinisalibacter lacisalsi TaxID=1526570 RepID=A0ABQ1QC96_9RHOB|nr:transcriptional regulator [Sinisalibacter lacisalsi]